MTKPDLTPESIPVEFPETHPIREGWTRERLLGLGQSLLVKQLNPIYVMKSRHVIAGNSRIHAARMVKKTHLFGYILDGNLTELEQKQWEIFDDQ